MSDDIRLLVLSHNYPRFEGDFAGVFLSVLNQRLPELGIQPIVLAPHHAGAKEDEILGGVRVVRFRYADDPAKENLAYHGQMHKLVLRSVTGLFRFQHFLSCFRKAAFQIVEKEKIQIIAGHWLIPAGLVMKTIHKRYRLPMILSSHGTDIRLLQNYSKTAFPYLKNFCRQLDSWTMVSSFLREAIIRIEPSLENTISVLPLPHDESIFYHDSSVTRKENLITCVTRFTEQKRVGHLLRAFALVTEKNDSARLKIVAGGPLQNDAEQTIAKLGLKDKVIIFEPVAQDELRKIYNEATIVVLNSFEEGFGLALSEAMLCGAPVIGTDSGGIKDIIDHEKTGLLVKVDDTPALAEAILRLLSDNALRLKLAENGHTTANQVYSSKALAIKYADIIKAAVNKPR